MREDLPEGVRPSADGGTGEQTRARPDEDAGAARSVSSQFTPVGDTTPHRVDRLTDTTKLPPVPDDARDSGTVHGELGEPIDYQPSAPIRPAPVPTHARPGPAPTAHVPPVQAPPTRAHTPPRGAGPPGAEHGFPAYQPPHRQPGPARRPSRPAAGTKAAEDRTRAIVFRGLGLLAIAVVSGLVWFAIRYDGGGTSSGAGPIETASGKYDFARAHTPVRDDTCSPHAYDQIKVLLRKFPCEGMVRTLYTSTPEDGRTAVSSVAVVAMPSERSAKLLRLRTTQDGTGNVTDLPQEGVTVRGAPDALNEGGFAAKSVGSRVIIVESDFLTADASEDEDADRRLLDEVSKDALRLGVKVRVS